MDKEDYRTLTEQIRPLLLKRMDFKEGVVLEMNEEAMQQGRVLDVCWKGNIHFVLEMYSIDFGWYFAERDGEMVSCIHRVSKFDEQFYRAVQHFLGEINQGDFDHKQTVSEQVIQIIEERQLTSYMNNTKWKEFLHVMTEELSVKVPYAFRTLFDVDGRNDDCFDTCYCQECFNGYHFKSLEWVKVKPVFCERKHRGRLIADEEIWYDLEEEFVENMKKYSIPYEVEDGIYTIYGYR